MSIAMQKHRQKPLSTATVVDRSFKGISLAWLLICASTFLGMYFSFCLHYRLPSPTNQLGFSPETSLSEFSEKNAIETISYLSETIGYRKFKIEREFTHNLYNVCIKELLIDTCVVYRHCWHSRRTTVL